MAATDATTYDSATHQLVCKGEWNISHLPNLENLLKNISWPAKGSMTINGAGISNMDSAGAWLLVSLQQQLQAKGLQVTFQQLAENYQTLINIISESIKKETIPSPPSPIPWLMEFGMNTIDGIREFLRYLSFIGQLTFEALRVAKNPIHLRVSSIAAVIYRNGYQSLPIIALLSFMIGVVITYQMGLQLRNYGANIYIVDLLGLAVLREFGPLITAIMVAGRTGSAFTAQLGMMKLNQEIDALDTMGVTPAELLLLPRIIGLVIALPLVTIWADVFGILGGMVISNSMLSITWYDFLHRFEHVIPLRAFLIGIGKTPIFALIISTIGCYQGMMVKDSADSVGLNTTRSVVLSIFFIIVADAIFSVIFSKLKL